MATAVELADDPVGDADDRPHEGLAVRHIWSDAKKLQIVRESQVAGAVVADVARRHGIRPQHLTAWRRAVREGWLVSLDDEAGRNTGFVPLEVTGGQDGADRESGARIGVKLGDIELTLPADMSVARIAELVLALRARP